MRKMPKIAALVLAALLPLCSGALAQETPKFDLGNLPGDHILLPDGPVTATVFLISDQGGWSAADQQRAVQLQSKAIATVGIDLPSYLANLATITDDCIYTISDIEAVNQQILRNSGSPAIVAPIIAGIGDGGGLAMAMAAQTPEATIGQFIAIDPSSSIALKKQLCTPASKTPAGERMIYGLTDGTLPAPVKVLWSPQASAQAQQHVADLSAVHNDIEVSKSTDDAATQLDAALSQTLDRINANAGEAKMPLTILEAKPTMDTLAIIYSGDGGWRDIDMQVADILQKQGVPVVGVDSLHYFWSEKKPADVAADLAQLIQKYTAKWKVKNVVLIGYSFGADILPTTFSLLPAELQKKVAQISLLALSHQADFEISVTGWLGVAGSGAQGDPVDYVAKLDPKLFQCVYGTEEDDSACPALKEKGIETIAIEGGHHFDEDYEALTNRIVNALKQRLAK